MNKLLMLVACVLGTISAGRIPQRDISTVDQRIERMSWQDLQRQKFLLEIVQRVQQPLLNDDLIQLDQGLIMDENRYRGGIDEDMQRVIDLDRERRLLDEHQICSIRNVEHVQQLRGIYQLLVRAIDFETLQRNVVYLRRNINPVLLINALTLAIRDREDTQTLIMPAMPELLPELYLDPETIEHVKSIQLEVEHSVRPSLMDLIGLKQQMRQVNPVMRMMMPWRDLHLQMAQKVNMLKNRVVVPIQSTSADQDATLLTEDIGMHNFMQNLIQELAILEDNTKRNSRQIIHDETVEREHLRQDIGRMEQNIGNIREQTLRRDEDDNADVQYRNRVPLQRGIGENIRGSWTDHRQLPTVNINSDRIINVGRRRQNEDRSENEDELLQSRYMPWVSEGRRVVQEKTQSFRPTNTHEDNTQRVTDNLKTVSRNDERLVHVNRRRLSQPTENMTPQRIMSVGEGRRLNNMDRMAEEDVMHLTRIDNRLGQLSEDDIIQMLRMKKNQQEEARLVGNDYWRQGDIYGRNFDQLMDNVTPRRVVRRVGSVETMPWQDAMRSEEHQGQLSDEEIVSMMNGNPQRKKQTEQERFMGLVRGDRLSKGRHVDQWQQQQDQYRNRFLNVNHDEEELQHIDNLQSVHRDDERLVHISRRRLNQPMDTMTPRRSRSIGEGVMHPITEEDIMHFIRSDNRLAQLSDEEIVEMLRRNRQRKGQMQDEVEKHTSMEQGHRYRRSLVSNVEERTARRSEVLLHTLRQLLARINQERMSMRLKNDEIADNSRQIPPYQDQAQRYAMRLNEMRLESRYNRAMLEKINNIESRLQQVIGQLIREMSVSTEQEQFMGQLRIERLIGDVLVGHLGDIGILRICRELLQDSNVQMDRSGLGVRMNNRVLQYTLRRVMAIVDEQRNQQLGAYRREQLDMQDVKINDVRISKLRTRLEDFDMDVSNLLEQPQQMQMLVRQRRLSNKPFTIDMDISSKRSQDVIVRVFLGPRMDVTDRVLSLEQCRSDFTLLDAINTQLVAGRNQIQLRSTDIDWTTRDATPFSEIYRRVMTTMRGKEEEQVMLPELIGENGRFPQRLLLPRGRPEGLPMQLFVIVSPFDRLEGEETVRLEHIGGLMGTSKASLMDSRPLGYPLDRRIDNEQQLLQMPNVQMQEVVIVHEN